MSLCMSLSHPPILLSQVPSSCSSVSEQKGSSTRECLTQGCSLLLAELTEEPGSPYSTALGRQCVPNRALSEKLCLLWLVQSLERSWPSARQILLLSGQASRAHSVCVPWPQCSPVTALHMCGDLVTIAPEPTHVPSATLAQAVRSWLP